MKVEITVEKTQRVTLTKEITIRELQSLHIGVNPFYEEFEEEFSNETGNIEYDYAVNDELGRTIINWN